MGIVTTASNVGTHTFLTHEVKYLLKFMVNEQDSIIAEKRLDDLQKQIMERLEDNIGLTAILFEQWVTATEYSIGDLVKDANINYEAVKNHTSAAANKPANTEFWKLVNNVLPDDSWPERVETLRMELDGMPIRGRMITWNYLFATT